MSELQGCPGPSREFHMMFPLGVGPTGKGSRLPSTGDGPGSVPELQTGSSEALRRKLPMGMAIVGRAYRNEISPRRARIGCGNSSKPSCRSSSIRDVRRYVPFEDVASVPVRVAWASEKHAPTAHDIPAKDLVGTDSLRGMVYHLVQVQRFYLDLLRLPRGRLPIRGAR